MTLIQFTHYDFSFSRNLITLWNVQKSRNLCTFPKSFNNYFVFVSQNWTFDFLIKSKDFMKKKIKNVPASYFQIEWYIYVDQFEL